MSDTYNGWTNYATWRVNLEMFDGQSAEDLGCFTRYEEPDTSDVAQYLREWAEESISNDAIPEGLAIDYALAFLDQVNWYEIAQHFVDEWNELRQEEEREEEEESDE
jgi:hypothetical protein